MKFNWGTGIALFYTLFAGTLVFLVIKSTTYDNSLVYEDYYAKDISYQKHYDRIQNTKNLSGELNIAYIPESRTVSITFPDSWQNPRGEIVFYNPAFQNLDYALDVATDAHNTQLVPVGKLRNGRWKIKVDWESNGKEFYAEQEVVL